ncbi:hypothetical protein TNIN_314991 [Trichonephila inaurata madagascariensis]|uniref:Uncharacterized protein n=1 Tax=Trichonephila inaurata madagascariensis TaxID=2747483 RepID=A0A8X6WP16_9ARAC|nr:hypothetical protein TNIN_314991 [Trichonephila inaurata madagascariensis]
MTDYFFKSDVKARDQNPYSLQLRGRGGKREKGPHRERNAGLFQEASPVYRQGSQAMIDLAADERHNSERVEKHGGGAPPQRIPQGAMSRGRHLDFGAARHLT